MWKIFLLASLSLATDVRSVLSNRQGIKDIEKKQGFSSQKEFLDALEKEPFDAHLHLNLGIAFQINKEPEKAIKEFLTALKYAQNDETKFYAYFNAGQAVGSNNVDQALQYYQSALDINPESKETKHNIELLLQSKQGKGGGDKKDNQDKENKEPDENQDRTNEQNKNEPQPYKNKELSENDVQKILEELKNQEQKVRAKENKAKNDRDLDKDW